MQHDFPKLLTLHPARKDKYEKKLLWYWLDTAYIGKMKSKEEEKLTRTTDLGEADVKNVPMGLTKPVASRGGPMPPDFSDDDHVEITDDDDDDDDGSAADTDEDGEGDSEEPSSGGKNKSPKRSKRNKGKKSGSKSFDEEVPDEEWHPKHVDPSIREL